MVEFNLTVNEKKVNKLACKELKENLLEMYEAVAGVNKNQWKYAIHLNNIIVNEYFKPDYKSRTEFADDNGIDKSTISRYVGAVKAMVNDVTPLTGYTMEQIPYSKASRLASLKDVKAFLNDTKIDLLKVSVHDLEKLIREYKKGLEPTAVNESKEAETKQEAIQEKEDASFTGRIYDDSISFSIDNVNYVIPLDELKHYRVK